MENKMTIKLTTVFFVVYWIVIISFFISQTLMHDEYSAHKPRVEILGQNASYRDENGQLLPIECKDIYFILEKEQKNKHHEIALELPSNIHEGMSIAIFSGNYDLHVKIDGKTRASYSDKENRRLGTYSPGKYVFIYLNENDSKGTMEIFYDTTLGALTTQVCAPVIGTDGELYLWLLYRYVWQIISAILLLTLGVGLFVYSTIVSINGRDDKGINYLGSFCILIAFWIIGQLDIRNYYFISLNDAALMTSFCLMLVPIPMLLFFNKLSKFKYKKYFNSLAFVALVNFTIITLLTWTNVIDICEWLLPTRIIILASCGVCFDTYVKYSRTNKVEAPNMVMLGMVGLILTTIMEFVNVYITQSFYFGKYIGFGILFFIVMLGYAAIKGMAEQEKEYYDILRENSEKTSFLANMSHEIRTPINTIMGMDEMILRESHDKNIEQYALNIRNSGRLLLSLVNDILDYSKLNSGNASLSPRRYDFRVLMNDVVNALKIRADEKNLEIVLNIDNSIPAILYGDDLRIKQVIANVLVNAVKYTKEGSVTLSVSCEEKAEDEINLMFSVTDTGVGIKKEDMERMFDSFVRLEPDKNRSIEGTGLGMAITKFYIDLMGGKIEVESEYGKGTTFYIHISQKIISDIPIGPIEEWYRAFAKKHINYIEKYHANKLKILLVDDNEMNIEVIKGLLKYTGIEIDEATSGYECLEKVKENDYDIILLDHMMPGMDGVETLMELKKDRTDIPVVALTANAVSGSREEYLNIGFADYIAKPVDYNHLVEVLARFLPDKFKMKKHIVKAENEMTNYFEKNGINIRNAIRYADGDYAQYSRLAGMLVSEQGKRRCIELEKAYKAQDWNTYSILVHGLKNSARTIGADKLADIAYEHEIRSKEENSCYIIENYDKLILEWTRVIGIIETYRNKQETDKNENSVYEGEEQSPLDDVAWQHEIGMVIGYLNAYKKKEAILILQKLAKSKLSADKQRCIEQTITAVQNYDYECAIEYLESYKI